jgi:hypothetical protein
MISKFNLYINEGIRDKMIPKSKEDIKKSLDELGPINKIKKIFINKVQGLYTKDEIDEMLKEVPSYTLLEIAIYNLNDLEMVKKLIEDGVDLTKYNNELLKDITGAWHYDDNILDLFDHNVLEKNPEFVNNWFIIHGLENTKEEQEKIINFYKEVLKLFLSNKTVLKKLSAIEIMGYRSLLGLN